MSMLLGKDAALMPDAAVLGEMEVKAAVVPAAGENESRYGHDGDEKYIKNTKIDKHLRDANLVPAIAYSKRNDVVKPQKVRPPRKHGEIPANAGPHRSLAAIGEGAKSQDQPCEGAYGKEAPLVPGRGEGRDKV